MNFLSIITVLFLLSDQILSLFTPFSSGLGVCLFILSLSINFCMHQGPRNSLKLWFFGIRSRKILIFTTYAFGLSIYAPCRARLLFSLSTTFLVMVGCIFIKNYIQVSRLNEIIKPQHAVKGLIFIFVSLLLARCGIDIYSWMRHAPTNRPSGLYLEPSHLALYSCPLAASAISKPETRVAGIALCVSIILMNFSLTAHVIAIGLVVIHTIHRIFEPKPKSSPKKITVFLPLLAIFIVSLLHCTYIGSRLWIVDSQKNDSLMTTNLSTLVYLNGWLLAKASYIKTLGLGLGLGNMGVCEAVNVSEETLSSAVLSITNESHNSLTCVRDGSFLSSKIISELGTLGVLLITWYVIRFSAFISSMFKIRFDLPLTGAFVLSSTLLFVRGLPYFSASVVWCVMMFGSYASVHRTKNIY
jgi:hypothetical protein